MKFFQLLILVLGFTGSAMAQGNWQIEDVTDRFGDLPFEVLKISPTASEQVLRFDGAYIDVDSTEDEATLNKVCGFILGKNYVSFVDPTKKISNQFIFLINKSEAGSVVKITAAFDSDHPYIQSMPNLINKRVLKTIYCRTISQGESVQHTSTPTSEIFRTSQPAKKTNAVDTGRQAIGIDSTSASIAGTSFIPFGDFTCDPKNYVEQIKVAFKNQFAKYVLDYEDTSYRQPDSSMLFRNPKNWKIENVELDSNNSLRLNSKQDVTITQTIAGEILLECNKILGRRHTANVMGSDGRSKGTMEVDPWVQYGCYSSDLEFIFKASVKVVAKSKGDANGCMFHYLLKEPPNRPEEVALHKKFSSDVQPHSGLCVVCSQCTNGSAMFATTNNLDTDHYLILGVPVTAPKKSK